MRKLFGELNLTWPKVIIFAIIAGLYTGFMAYLPQARDTSFADISITFEWWVLFGTIIIMNSKSNLDSGLKCIVFFLISQPLVYLVQVPFSALGWGIFQYYRNWFIWTLLTFPIGFIGYYLRKDKWWGLFILVPVMLFVGFHYSGFLRETISFFPNHLLSTVFCAATIIIYSLFIFKDKKIIKVCFIIALCILVAMTGLTLFSGSEIYNTTLLIDGGELDAHFDDTYTAYLEDESFGQCDIVYEDGIEGYMVNVGFRKTGHTRLILEAPDGTKQYFDLEVERHSYEITESTENDG